ncbi:hypothetical protein KSP40_PGU019972 [Platanthera guangdongensis]|uniref:Uncharacterized protein n=1 Tax=Platanthera guangdongensis TaxID=2320717 RepID=A0ABR2MKZ2_9ASPA
MGKMQSRRHAAGRRGTRRRQRGAKRGHGGTCDGTDGMKRSGVCRVEKRGGGGFVGCRKAAGPEKQGWGGGGGNFGNSDVTDGESEGIARPSNVDPTPFASAEDDEDEDGGFQRRLPRYRLLSDVYADCVRIDEDRRTGVAARLVGGRRGIGTDFEPSNVVIVQFG